MSRRSRSLVKAALCLMLLMLAFLPLRSLVAQNGAVEDHAGGPQDLVQVVLHAGPAPAVGGTALLTLEATPFAAAPDFVLQWQVPEGVELLGAAEQHFGPVSAGEPVSSAREVRFVQEGLHKIAATAMLDYGPDAQFAASGVVFYTIQPGTSSVSDKDPTARSPMRSKMAAQITTSAPDMAPNAVNGDPCFTVAGTVTRWELTPQPGGYKSSFWCAGQECAR
ncbi:MAG: hypothetical protein ACK2UK_12705 [Candidatus Promineifilaceae bacterium]